MFIIAAAALAVLAQAPTQPDCAAGDKDPMGFMAAIGGGSSTSERIGGTIVDPPAPKTDRLVVGGLSSPATARALAPRYKAKPSDPAQEARDEAAGICNVKQPA